MMTAPTESEGNGMIISASSPDALVWVELDGTTARRVPLFWHDCVSVGITPKAGDRIRLRSLDTDPFPCGPAVE